MAMSYGRTSYERIKPCGKMVLLKKLKPSLDSMYGDLYIPYIKNKDTAIGHAKIVALGPRCGEKEGLKEGEYCMYDYYSVFHDGPEYVVTRAENIFMIVTEEEALDLSK